jgi:hypothetical protein
MEYEIFAPAVALSDVILARINGISTDSYYCSSISEVAVSYGWCGATDTAAAMCCVTLDVLENNVKITSLGIKTSAAGTPAAHTAITLIHGQTISAITSFVTKEALPIGTKMIVRGIDA